MDRAETPKLCFFIFRTLYFTTADLHQLYNYIAYSNQIPSIIVFSSYVLENSLSRFLDLVNFH